jgi:hypothetical protein
MDNLNTEEETPVRPKRGRDDQTPTPTDERRDGTRVKSLKVDKGQPIHMDKLDENKAENSVETIKSQKIEVLGKSGESAESMEIEELNEEYLEDVEKVRNIMKVAPPWARVLRHDILDFRNVSSEVHKAVKLNDTRVKELEDDNVKLNQRVKVNEDKLVDMSNKFEKMQLNMKKLEEKVLRQEVHARKPNLLFCGIAEDGRDTWDECRRKINNVMAKMSLGYDPAQIKVDRVHRLGIPPRNGREMGGNTRPQRPRPIIVGFNWNYDRDRVWRQRGTLRNVVGVHLEEDQPQEIEARRQRLLPVYRAAMELPYFRGKTFLNGDRLTVEGTHYTVDNMHELPEPLDARKLATPTQDDVTKIGRAHV